MGDDIIQTFHGVFRKVQAQPDAGALHIAGAPLGAHFLYVPFLAADADLIFPFRQ